MDYPCHADDSRCRGAPMRRPDFKAPECPLSTLQPGEAAPHAGLNPDHDPNLVDAPGMTACPVEVRMQDAAGADRLSALIDGYQAGALLYTAIKLDLPDHLLQPTATAAIASRLNLSAPHLARLLRALTGIGVCVETAPGTYALTREGQLLTRDAGLPLREQAILAVEQYWPSWAALEHSVATGQTAFRHLYGMDPWQYRRDHPEQGAVFQAWLAKETRAVSEAVVADLDLAGAETVVDIAAGGGSLAAALLAADPRLVVSLFDLPEVLERTRLGLSLAPDHASRCRWIPGDFFTAVPSGHDLYLIKSVLHDWDDAHCLQILGRCREAMSQAARLVLIERRLPEYPAIDHRVSVLDICMMALHGGRERSLTEYRELLRRSGFALQAVRDGSTGFAMLEAVPG